MLLKLLRQYDFWIMKNDILMLILHNIKYLFAKLQFALGKEILYVIQKV